MKKTFDIDTSFEYSSNDICSTESGGCGYHKNSCVCDFQKNWASKKEKNGSIGLQQPENPVIQHVKVAG